jgi:hypothetical protein
MKRFNTLIFHPFFFAAYPALALLSTNIEEVSPVVVVRPLLVSLLLALILFGIFRLVSRNWQKAALCSSLILVLFFSYGHIYDFLKTVSLGGLVLGRHRLLGVAFLLILGVGFWLVLTRLRHSENLTQFLNLVSVIAILLPAAQISFKLATANTIENKPPAEQTNTTPLQAPKDPPDVYYIILDTYTRGDVLKDKLGYDNAPFLNALAAEGFYIAGCSRSNYAETSLSLSSSLNMTYLDKLDIDMRPGTTELGKLHRYIQYNQVRADLEAIGYKTVAFENEYIWLQISDADIYLKPGSHSLLIQQLIPFESLFLRGTAAVILLDAQTIWARSLTTQIVSPYSEHIAQQLFLLDSMETIAQIPGPKFVYAHVLIPHSPFVFAADGSIQTDILYFSNSGRAADEEHYRQGYINGVQYVNSRIIQIVRNILRQSKTPPIIIIQGDTGDDISRMSILNAYYLPGGNYSNLYPSITPVNTFRVVFNTLYGTNYEMLDDVSYFSVYDDPYNFDIRAEDMPGCR